MAQSFSIGLILFSLLLAAEADDLPTCQAHDFHFEYTECDSQGGRWRVSVPEPNTCIGGAPNPPVRGKGCDFTCKAGQYLDIQGDQDCHPCAAGTYSLGGGERFDDWDTLPAGFSSRTEKFSSSFLPDPNEDSSGSQNCSSSGWTAQGKYISSIADQCSASLVYTAVLVKAGSVRFSYQYPDEEAIFHFQVQNNQCQTVGDKASNKWPSQTKSGEWKHVSVQLKSGMNVLYWKTLEVGSEKSRLKRPIRIKDIEITGIAYSSQCSKCPNGTYSEEGTSVCSPCPANTYSQKGAGQCTPCNRDTQYSPEGSSSCTDRPPCTEDDYFEYNGPCDSAGMTQKMYKWIEPKTCKDTLTGSATLPASGAKEECPPCNPGMEYSTTNGSCQFCKSAEYSDGSGKCQACPASTAPDSGITIKWWNNLPANANVSSSCLSISDQGCAGEEGWQGQVDHIESGKGHADDAYLVLSLDISGFKGDEQIFAGKPVPVAEVSFVFETQCTKDCSFFFMQQTQTAGTTVIETFEGRQQKQKYSFQVQSVAPVTYLWAYQKLGSGGVFGPSRGNDNTYNLKNDKAIVYSVNVTNTLIGGAARCKKCPKGANVEGCIPCPERNYIDLASSACKPCPDNTVVHGHTPWGKESCIPCGEGLRAKGNKCVSDCKYTSATGQEYDFKKLPQFKLTDGARLFTASGTQYYHRFNFTLCGDEELVQCRDNISYPGSDAKEVTNDEDGNATESETTNNMSFGIRKDATEVVISSLVCRTTIIPPRPGETDGVMAAQPVSLGDILVNITNNGSSLNIAKRLEEEGFSASAEDSENAKLDVHFTYVSEVSTQACKNGRSTIITMRCDISQTGNGTILVPPKCPDGTCDGCNFHFLWRTRKACPICKDEEFQVVKGECIDNKQEVHYIPPSHCIFMQDSKATVQTQSCTVSMPQWLQIIIYVVPALVGLGVLLLILLCYCWMKNRKLEYKYMKLVAGSNSRDDELPAAETCALDEDDDEQFDAVEFKESKGRKFFSKLANLNKKDDMIPLQMPAGKDDMSEI